MDFGTIVGTRSARMEVLIYGGRRVEGRWVEFNLPFISRICSARCGMRGFRVWVTLAHLLWPLRLFRSIQAAAL